MQTSLTDGMALTTVLSMATYMASTRPTIDWAAILTSLELLTAAATKVTLFSAHMLFASSICATPLASLLV